MAGRLRSFLVNKMVSRLRAFLVNKTTWSGNLWTLNGSVLRYPHCQVLSSIFCTIFLKEFEITLKLWKLIEVNWTLWNLASLFHNIWKLIQNRKVHSVLLFYFIWIRNTDFNQWAKTVSTLQLCWRPCTKTTKTLECEQLII